MNAVAQLLLKIIEVTCCGAVAYAFVRPVFSGAPYAVTAKSTVDDMVRLLGDPCGRRAADLGSGDGRIVIALARAGFEAHGYELNPFLVWYSRLRIRRAGLGGRAFIHRKNYWQESMAPYGAVTIFGITYIMDALGRKLQRELSHGSVILCNHFMLRSLKPVRRLQQLSLYVV